MERSKNDSSDLSTQNQENKSGLISARQLQLMQMPPVSFWVEGLLTNGLAVIAGPPKYGKSFFSLQLCGSIAVGAPFLGHATRKCDTLYLALEDSESRLQARLNMQYQGDTAPEGMYIANHCPNMDDGLLESLDNHLRAHPGIGVVVVDTLQKVRGRSFGRDGSYATDYRELSEMKMFADSHHIALVLIHHLRKMGDDGDPFNRISGTTGIMGVADTIIVLTRTSRTDNETQMSITGRDIESGECILTINKDTGKWEKRGEVDDYVSRAEYEEHRSNAVAQTIRELVERNPEGWSGTATDILREMNSRNLRWMPSNAKAVGSEITKIERKLLKYDCIHHTTTSNGTGGRKHHFFRSADCETIGCADELKAQQDCDEQDTFLDDYGEYCPD